jgi:hypothetical protein
VTDPLVLPFSCPDNFDPGRPIIRISPGGTRVFVSSHPSDEWALVLDVPSGRRLREFTVLKRLTRPLFLDEDRLVLFDEEGSAVHELTTKSEVEWGEPIPGGDGWLSPDPNVIVTGGNHFGLYDVAARKEVRHLPHLLNRDVTSVGFSPDGRYLAAEFCESYRCSPVVGVWDLTVNRLLRLYETFSENECHDIALTADCRFAVCTNGFIAVFGPDHAEEIGPHFHCIAESLRFSASGHSLEVIEYNGAVAWVDPLTGRAVREEPPAGHEVTGCATTAGRLAAGVAGRTVLVWQLPRWEEAEPSAAPDRGGTKVSRGSRPPRRRGR